MAAAVKVNKKLKIIEAEKRRKHEDAEAADKKWRDDNGAHLSCLVKESASPAVPPHLDVEDPSAADEGIAVDVATAPKPNAQWPRSGFFWYYQSWMRSMYEGSWTQVGVAVLIMLNFLCNVVEKEIDPHGIHAKEVWRAFEHSFNAIFLVELLINMYSRWRRAFWCDGWNIFDLIVVSVGCISFFVELDGPLKLLRCLRAFRVFRLFKRVKALNRIIMMILAAIPGVMNAFLVIVIMISIYSLVAVEFFSTFGVVKTSDFYDPAPSEITAYVWDPTLTVNGDESTYLNFGTGSPSNNYISNATHRTPVPECSYLNAVGGVVDSVTARNLCHGVEYWGTFTRAWYTLFQVLTGESWSEAIARPVLFGWNEYGSVSVYISALFFISFVLINTFILFNVFVAVLLDKVIQPEEESLEGVLKASSSAGAAESQTANGITLYPWATGPIFSDKVVAQKPQEEADANAVAEGVGAASTLSETELDDAKKMFHRYDRDSDGCLDYNELRALLLSSLNISPDQAADVISKYDKDINGTLDLNEFCMLFSEVRSMTRDTLVQVPVPKTPAKMLERVLENQNLLLIEQRQRADEARDLKQMLTNLLERLHKLENGVDPLNVEPSPVIDNHSDRKGLSSQQLSAKWIAAAAAGAAKVSSTTADAQALDGAHSSNDPVQQGSGPQVCQRA